MNGKSRHFGELAPGLPSTGTLVRRRDEAPTAPAEGRTLGYVLENLREQLFPHRPRAAGRKLRLLLDRKLARFRKGAGAGVFELLARALAVDKSAPGLAAQLSNRVAPLPVLLLDRSRQLVLVEPGGKLVGLNRAALEVTGLSARGCLVATALAHGLRAAARLRAGEAYDGEKERARDVQNFLLLLVGVRGTEWEVGAVREELATVLDGADPFLASFAEYGRKLQANLSRRPAAALDDRVFRDGALFDRLPGREKLKVVAAGTLAWYGVLSLGLLRLPRRFLARHNAYYETAWWIFRAKPGGRRLLKGPLVRRAMQRLRRLRLLSAFEYLWSAWNPKLAVTCLRPVYRSAGGNRRPFTATLATFAYTALVIHPLWITLSITGVVALLGLVFPGIHAHTRIASRENLLLHGIVIGFWLTIGLLVATSKLLRRPGRPPE
ncbi:MAG: hypothetical protein MUE73_19890 [Planctomycetes bacterium]|jgi:hypothetical protein|nr:hypothetical protein [Planctomycetota bacterium]